METLLSILKEIDSDVDFEHSNTLIDDKILDSFALLSLVSEIEDTFGIQLTPADLVPQNFNSMAAMMRLIESKTA